jgi:Family of unknown function (DUF6104)
VYFTDRGIEELEERRGAEQVSVSWLTERLRDFVDEQPETEGTVNSLASWLARLDDDADDFGGEPGDANDTVDAVDTVDADDSDGVDD